MLRTGTWSEILSSAWTRLDHVDAISTSVCTVKSLGDILPVLCVYCVCIVCWGVCIYIYIYTYVYVCVCVYAYVYAFVYAREVI